MKKVYDTSYNADKLLEARVSLIKFKEDNAFITYCPALDLSGYGNTQAESDQSFELALEEFFRFTLEKKTLMTELERLGWKKKENDVHSSFNQPDFHSLLVHNDYLNSIFSEKEFNKVNRNIHMPSIASC